MRRRSIFPLMSAVGILVLLGAAFPALAGTIVLGDGIPLSELVDDGTVVVGDKEFEMFTYAETGDMPPATEVNAIPIQDGFGNFGLRFQGAFLDLFGGGGSDALITYQVTALDPRFLLSDAHLVGNPLVVGEGALAVTETFLPDDPTVLSIYDVPPGAPKLTDFAFFATPVDSLFVQKDILAFASDQGSVATLSFVDQTFSQVVVPEPSTVGLLILGLAAACGLRRKSHGRRR